LKFLVFVLFETGIGCIIYKKIIQDHEFGNKLSEIWISNKIDILPLALISLLADGLNSLDKESEISASSR